MALKPLLSFNLSVALCLVGIFGVIFLTALGLAYLFGSEQFTSEMSAREQGDAVRACFVSAAIYAALTVISVSQLFLHKKFKSEIGLDGRSTSIELVSLEPNDAANPKSSTPLARQLSSVSTVLEKRRQ